MNPNAVAAYLSRPDVRRSPVRLLARRARVELIDRFAQGRLDGERALSLPGGLRVSMPLSDTVGRELYVHGAFEWDVVSSLLGCLPDDGVLVDVGAHVGSYTLYAARLLSPTGRVIAFEPDDANRARLTRHLELNQLSGVVTVLPWAVSDTEQSMTLGSPSPENSGMSQLGIGTRVVECRTLDSVLNGLGVDRLDVVKIDVEGFERAVLAGGRETIHRFRPVIFTEVNDDLVTDTLIREFDYEVFSTADGAPIPLGAQMATLRRPGAALNVYAKPRPR